MPITIISCRQFNRHASKARKAANAGPVFITDGGCLTHVLLSYPEYRKITGGRSKIADLLAMLGSADGEFEITPFRDLAQTLDLS